MCVFQLYEFQIGRKLLFPQWPEVVHRFLQGQGLHYETFAYYFADPVMEGSRSGCERAAKENPRLGQVQCWVHPVSQGDEHALTNMDDAIGCSEEEFLRSSGAPTDRR